MAYSVSLIDKHNEANLRVQVLSIVADAATQTVSSSQIGLKAIKYFTVGPKSMAVSWRIHHNKDASGAVSNGALGISGLTSGDELIVVCYGR